MLQVTATCIQVAMECVQLVGLCVCVLAVCGLCLDGHDFVVRTNLYSGGCDKYLDCMTFVSKREETRAQGVLM